MAKVQARLPSGFNEYLPHEQIEFNRLLDIIRTTYEAYGFSPIDTPDIELSEVLLAKGGGETDQQIYRFEKGRNDLSLRFDLTVPLARYAAQHQSELTFPFRRYHIGKVHRAERAQAGRFREFYQCDIDVIGSESSFVDAEFPAIINDIFAQFNFGEFTIRVNNRKVLTGFFESLGLAEQATDILRLVDKMEKITRQEFLDELASLRIDEGHIRQILDFMNIQGANDEILHQLEAMNSQSEVFRDGVSDLKLLVAALRKMEVPESRFNIDLKIARGLDYYTGTVYETVLNDHPGVGSVCSGGRYDNLASYYTNTNLPGVGISIGLSRLFYKLLEVGIIAPTRQSPAEVMVMPLEEAQFEYGLEVAAQLRKAGIATIFYTEPQAAKKKFRYADRMGFTYVLIMGEQEAKDGKVTVKNMQTGESALIDKAAVTEFIAQ